MEKIQLRRKIATLRDTLSPEVREEYSARIRERLESLPEYQAAGVVSYFVSFRSEVNTVPVIQDALENGKRVLLPITELEKKQLIFSELRNFAIELSPGAYGILEPGREYIRPVPGEEIDIVLAPGLVFDLRGYRVGYGGGFYDRFLASLEERPLVVALAFDLQVIKEPVPHEKYDIPVDLIVTEKRLIICNEDNLEKYISAKKKGR